MTVPQVDFTFLLLLPTIKDPINGSLGFLRKILDMSNIVCQPIRGLFGRPDKSF